MELATLNIYTADGNEYNIPCNVNFFENDDGKDFIKYGIVGYISYYDADPDVVEALPIVDQYVVLQTNDTGKKYSAFNLMYKSQAKDRYGNGLIQY